MELRNELVAGVAGGLAAGTVLALVMAVGKKTGVIPEPLPLKVEQEVEERADVQGETTPAQKNLLALGGHYLLSAVFGALYGLFRWVTGSRFSAIPTGPLYGLSTYAVNLVGLGPAMDLTSSPQEEKPVTVGRRVMMHAVFGTVTAFVAKKVRARMAA